MINVGDIAISSGASQVEASFAPSDASLGISCL